VTLGWEVLQKVRLSNHSRLPTAVPFHADLRYKWDLDIFSSAERPLVNSFSVEAYVPMLLATAQLQHTRVAPLLSVRSLGYL
jgi:hypothetical protein